MRREVNSVDELRAIVGHPNSYVAIPERPGNKRVDGRARVLADADYFDAIAVQGKRPVLALEIDVDEVFFHCAKAFLRSEAWDPSTWIPTALPSTAQIARAIRYDWTQAQLDEYYSEVKMRKILY